MTNELPDLKRRWLLKGIATAPVVVVAAETQLPAIAITAAGTASKMVPEVVAKIVARDNDFATLTSWAQLMVGARADTRPAMLDGDIYHVVGNWIEYSKHLESYGVKLRKVFGEMRLDDLHAENLKLAAGYQAKESDYPSQHQQMQQQSPFGSRQIVRKIDIEKTLNAFANLREAGVEDIESLHVLTKEWIDQLLPAVIQEMQSQKSDYHAHRKFKELRRYLTSLNRSEDPILKSSIAKVERQCKAFERAEKESERRYLEKERFAEKELKREEAKERERWRLFNLKQEAIRSKKQYIELSYPNTMKDWRRITVESPPHLDRAPTLVDFHKLRLLLCHPRKMVAPLKAPPSLKRDAYRINDIRIVEEGDRHTVIDTRDKALIKYLHECRRLRNAPEFI